MAHKQRLAALSTIILTRIAMADYKASHAQTRLESMLSVLMLRSTLCAQLTRAYAVKRNSTYRSRILLIVSSQIRSTSLILHYRQAMFAPTASDLVRQLITTTMMINIWLRCLLKDLEIAVTLKIRTCQLHSFGIQGAMTRISLRKAISLSYLVKLVPRWRTAAQKMSMRIARFTWPNLMAKLKNSSLSLSIKQVWTTLAKLSLSPQASDTSLLRTLKVICG